MPAIPLYGEIATLTYEQGVLRHPAKNNRTAGKHEH